LKLVVGLGNPGIEYHFTRHNIGWQVIDLLALRRGCPGTLRKFSGEFRMSPGLALLKPHTWMNLSGVAVRETVSFYKMEPEDVLIVCDDTALPFAHLRLRAKGSAGGHNGLASVCACLGTLNVPRLRVGVGGAPPGGDLRNWVLGHFSAQERALLPSVLDRSLEAVALWLEDGVDRAMNIVNSWKGKSHD
jgi:PTH1 family peptidyl-tRNA hydrolase